MVIKKDIDKDELAKTKKIKFESLTHRVLSYIGKKNNAIYVVHSNEFDKLMIFIKGVVELDKFRFTDDNIEILISEDFYNKPIYKKSKILQILHNSLTKIINQNDKIPIENVTKEESCIINT